MRTTDPFVKAERKAEKEAKKTKILGLGNNGWLLVFLCCVGSFFLGASSENMFLVLLGICGGLVSFVLGAICTSSDSPDSPSASSAQKSNDRLLKTAVLYSVVTAIHQREKILDKLEDNRSDGGTDGGTDMSGY